MAPIFTGSCVALITPFTKTGIDYAALDNLIEFQIENGTDAVLVCGTTGEPSTMDYEEEKELIAHTIKLINKRVKIIVGSGSNDTKSAIHYSITSENLGADALLLVTPYYNKCTQKGLVEHYTAIADSVNIPCILYNVPGRTGVNIMPQTALTLSSHKNIVAIKEASGNIEQICELISLTRGKMDVYSGDDGITVPMMSMGAIGVISVLANIAPKIMSNMTHKYLKGEVKKAAEIQADIFELCKSMFIEVNPIPVKTAANLMGLNGGELRLPLSTMENMNIEKLIAVLKKYKMI